MVATRSTDHEVIAFVTGKEKIDPNTIRVAQWVPILRSTIGEMPVSYMRGFKSLKEILTYDGSFGVECRITERFPTLQPRGALKLIQPTAVFLECARSAVAFPTGTRMHELYRNAPRRAGSDKLSPISSGYFLLARDKTLYYLSVVWVPKVQWDDESLVSIPSEFWYEADLDSLKIVVLNDAQLDLLLTTSDKRDIPLTILRRINMAMAETVNDMRGQYDHVLQKKLVSDEVLDRMGQLIC